MRWFLLAAIGAMSSCGSSLSDFAPLELRFASDADHDDNPRTPIITLVGRGDCRPLNATLNGQPPQRANCGDVTWQVSSSGAFVLTDGVTSVSFTILQVEPLIDGRRYQTHPSSPNYLPSSVSGRRVQLDMDTPPECLPADFETQLAQMQVQRSADGTLSFVAMQGLQLDFRALCVTECTGGTCTVLGDRDRLVVGVMTP